MIGLTFLYINPTQNYWFFQIIFSLFMFWYQQQLHLNLFARRARRSTLGNMTNFCFTENFEIYIFWYFLVQIYGICPYLMQISILYRIQHFQNHLLSLALNFLWDFSWNKKQQSFPVCVARAKINKTDRICL